MGLPECFRTAVRVVGVKHFYHQFAVCAVNANGCVGDCLRWIFPYTGGVGTDLINGLEPGDKTEFIQETDLKRGNRHPGIDNYRRVRHKSLFREKPEGSPEVIVTAPIYIHHVCAINVVDHVRIPRFEVKKAFVMVPGMSVYSHFNKQPGNLPVFPRSLRVHSALPTESEKEVIHRNLNATPDNNATNNSPLISERNDEETPEQAGAENQRQNQHKRRNNQSKL